MSIIDTAKQIAANPLVRHGEAGDWMSVYDPDSVAVARELLRLLDHATADYEWAKSVGLDEDEDGLHRRKVNDLCCMDNNEWYLVPCCMGTMTRGDVRCLAKVLGIEIKEGE